MQGKNPLHHQHMWGVDGGGLVKSSVFLERVNRYLGTFSVISISPGGRFAGTLCRMMRPTQL